MNPLRGIFIYQRVAHFARRPGNFVHVISPIPYFPSWIPGTRWSSARHVPERETSDHLEVDHPRYFLLPKISMPVHGLLMFLGSLFAARKIARRIKFDAIDAHYVYPDGFAAALLGKVLGLPVIVSARGTDINLFTSFRLIRPMIRWTLQHAAGVIAVSSALRAAMADLGVPAGKIRVIGNGVDTKRFAPIDRGSARHQLGLPEQGMMILSVGALIPSKGHQLIIAALSQLARRHPHVHLYVVGEGDWRERLALLARAAGVGDRVSLVGSRPNEELGVWYSAADVFCLASIREGMPNVILESLACGTPVVASRVGGIPEIINSSDLGILVDSNADAVASGLDLALNGAWSREALTGYASRRTWEAVAEEVENYMQSCTRQGN